MIDIEASVAVRDNCPGVSFDLTSVVSSEPDDTAGDGAFVNNIQGTEIGTDDVNFQVRAERIGGGPGRTYTAAFEATDGSGNTASDSTEVFVPASRRKN